MTASPDTFDAIVIGAGMMGAACARHMTEAGAKVLLLGPDEPASRATHAAPFASHHDSGRITRALDARGDWARLSRRAIGRYAGIEEASGIPFFRETGGMMAGPLDGSKTGFMASTLAVAEEQSIPHVRYEGAALAESFPFFAFPEGTVALHEPRGAGCIDPRALVRAQIALATAGGAARHASHAVAVDETAGEASVRCADGAVFRAPRAVIAAGAWSRELLPQRPKIDVYARTVALLEIDEAERARLAAMPTLVWEPDDPRAAPYLLPPLPYPDGRWYMKIGGDPMDQPLTTDAEIAEWFRTEGDLAVRDKLTEMLCELMPGLRYASLGSAACVTSFNAWKAPLIHPVGDCLFAVTVGNGSGAKCSDEIGRLGAVLALGGDLAAEGYESRFGPNG